MDFKVDALGPCRKHVTVQIPPERVREEFDRQYDEINESVALPGFRKGRAPRKILEKRFATTLGREVKEKLVQTALEKLVEDKKVDPLRPPDIDLEALALEPAGAFEFEFDLLTKPEFETPQYQGIELKVPPVTVTDDDVQAAVHRLLQGEATLKTVEDGQVEDEDVLVVDWKAMSGDSVEAHDDNAYYLFGRGVLAGFVAEGLDEALKGKGPGATASVAVKVGPDDRREELRDKELQLEVELKEIKRYALPEIDEGFLKRHDYDDEEEMRGDIMKKLVRARTRERDRQAEDSLVAQLLEGVEMSLPEEFVEKELESWAQRKRMQLQMEDVEADDIDKKIAAEREDAKTSVERDLRRFFLLDRIADEEDVKVAEEEILQAIHSIARVTGRPDEEVLASFQGGNRIAELATQIRHRKTGETIRRFAKIEESESAPADTQDGAKAEPSEAPAKKASGKKAAKKAKDAPAGDA